MKKTTSLAGLITLAIAQQTYAETQLNSIVVSPQNTEQNIADTSSNIHIITREEIDLKQHQTLPQALNGVPGLTISHNGGMGKQTSLFMRGSNRVLILLDGIPLNDPSNINNLANIESILLDNIERIEVLKGGQSGVWGANAAAGAINLITRKAQDKPTGSASLALGSDSLTHLNTNFSAKNSKAYFSYNFSTIKTDGYSAIKEINRSPRAFEKDGYSQTDTSFKLGITPTPTQTLEFFTKQSQMDADYDSTGPDFITADPNDANSERSVTTQIYQLSHQAKLDKTQIRTWVNRTKIEGDEGFGQNEATRRELGTQANFNYAATSQAQAFAQANESEFEGMDLTVKNKALGLNNSNRFGKLLLNQNIRYDHYKEFDNKTTGKLGAAYDFTTDIRLSANAGTSYTAPSIDQIENPWGNPNYDLKPENTKYWDLTLDLYDLSITYFASQVKQEIDWQNNTYLNRSEKVKYKAIETSYLKDISDLNTLVKLSYSYLDAKDFAGKKLEKRSKDTASINLTYYGLNKTRLNWETNYIGSTLDYRTGSDKQIGYYSTSNLSLDYQVTNNLNLNAKVSNIFNKDYTHAYHDSGHVYSTSGRIWQLRVKGSF